MHAVQLSRPIDGVALVSLNRPDVRNALDTAALEELLGVLDEVAGDESVRAMVVSTTSTVALCAGADVGEVLDGAAGVRRMGLFCRLYARLAVMPMPTVAVCVGNVLGAGTEIATACDLRVAGENLKLGWVGVRNGVPVGPARLVPLVGEARAKELIFSGRMLDATEAVALGLASSVHPEAEAEAVALTLAGEIAGRPGARSMKSLFRSLDTAVARVATENEALMAFQRDGAGLPKR